jgi:hypothetical protein
MEDGVKAAISDLKFEISNLKWLRGTVSNPQAGAKHKAAVFAKLGTTTPFYPNAKAEMSNGDLAGEPQGRS